ncbi:aminopeptidase N [Govanella unica]|nr:aminopeptidase N [Govania unica]
MDRIDADPAAAPMAIDRAAYRPPAFAIEHLDLNFYLDSSRTRVRSVLKVTRREAGAPLLLNGHGLELESIRIDGAPLAPARYKVTADSLIIMDVPDHFTLEIGTLINPEANTALEGLYQSRGLFCTQCEAEGFRRITYFPDRPDVMTTYRVRLEADREACPVLLSNGNLIDEGDLPGGRHFALWEDPFPKPSYLFALVAGHLGHIEDFFTTASGRRVTLRIYAAPRDLDKCDHAMVSLKSSMRWDEELYGREYDLDIFNIVAISDFNMGAMENKSLNLFNTKCVLAKAETATDADFAAVESIIAHEYFHNWTGNRVTCRDWFQLSLKEGLTVFRDQEFSADMGSRAVKRIEDVRLLRSHQFPEDSGPLAHPVRPDSYIEINNFYTATVYEKGAEIIRMIHSLLGPEGFRKGMDLYFERHDGQAVTCDDFVAAMEDATGVDLTQFRLWYSQAGTPMVEVATDYDAARQLYHLTLRQATPATPGQPGKKPLHMPIAVGLLGADGQPLDVTIAGNEGMHADAQGTVMLNLRDARETFTFSNVRERPVPSILRGFSAPVRVLAELSRDELRFLMAHDNDAFNRWEAGQRLATLVLLDLVAAVQAGRTLALETADIEAYRRVLSDHTADKALIAETLTLPSEGDIAAEMRVIDTDAIHTARSFMRATLGRVLGPEFHELYKANQTSDSYRFTAGDVAARQLKNMALGYLMAVGSLDATTLALRQFAVADNMTDEAAALRVLVQSDRVERHAALAAFYAKWRDEDLVIDKWFSLQATAPQEDTIDHVTALTAHADFTLRNPNRVRSLIGAFTQMNPVRFHDSSGRGYRFLREQVSALNSINPQIAARLLQPLGRWQKHDANRQALMKAELEALLKGDLSRDVYEVAVKSLGRG